jgi:hypothetical protein
MRYFEEIKSSSSNANGHFKRDKTNNAYRNEMTKKGIYVPKYSISEVNFGTPDASLELEFSAPKLLYGTNFKEVSQSDFPAIVDKLAVFLRSIQVIVDRSEIASAIVTLAAYARNIPVGKFGSTSEILWVMGHFDYRPRSEQTKKERHKELRESDGLSELKYFNDNSHLTLYDKPLEILVDPVTKEEREIAEAVRKGTVDETLRIELTLHTKHAVRQALSGIYDKQMAFTFTEAFKDDVRDTLLRNEVDTVFNHPLQKIVLLTCFDRDVFNRVIEKHCHTLAQRREMRIALPIIFTEGLLAYRRDILKHATPRTWFRYQKRLKRICDGIQLPQGATTQLNNAEFLEYFLSQFGIKSKLRDSRQQGLF